MNNRTSSSKINGLKYCTWHKPVLNNLYTIQPPVIHFKQVSIIYFNCLEPERKKRVETERARAVVLCFTINSWEILEINDTIFLKNEIINHNLKIKLQVLCSEEIKNYLITYFPNNHQHFTVYSYNVDYYVPAKLPE